MTSLVRNATPTMLSRMLLLALIPAFVAAAQAAEPLVWKFKAGEQQHYAMIQNLTIKMDLGQGEQSNDINQNIDMTWDVKEVKDDGNAVLTQKIDRMVMKTGAAGQEMTFDSASDDPAAGPMGAQLAPMFKALTSHAFTVTMTPRGEIVDVEVPEELIKALEAAPGAKMMGDFFTKEGFKNLVQQGSLTLPEKLEDGTNWSTAVEIKNPLFGKQTVKTTYKYVGPRTIEGVAMEVFAPTMTMEFGGGGAQIDVTGQESSGEIVFNRDAGRLEESQIKQGMDLKITLGPQTMSQSIDQTIELKWVKPEAK